MVDLSQAGQCDEREREPAWRQLDQDLNAGSYSTVLAHSGATRVQFGTQLSSQFATVLSVHSAGARGLGASNAHGIEVMLCLRLVLRLIKAV
jgi:hypothetical protein